MTDYQLEINKRRYIDKWTFNRIAIEYDLMLQEVRRLIVPEEHFDEYYNDPEDDGYYG